MALISDFSPLEDSMAHTITLSDEEYERLTQAAQLFEQTPHEMVSRWIAWLPQPKPLMTREEVEQWWAEHRRFVASLKPGEHSYNDNDDDEAIAEEAYATHADESE
jgi:predicted transcriptional regulator